MATDKKADRQDLDAMTREFLARGGGITRCDPGPSESVVYRNGPRRFKKPAAKTEAAPEQAAAPEPAAAPEGTD